MTLLAQFNGAFGPVHIEVEDVLEFHQKWGGFATVLLVDGQVREVAYRRLSLA